MRKGGKKDGSPYGGKKKHLLSVFPLAPVGEGILTTSCSVLPDSNWVSSPKDNLQFNKPGNFLAP